MPAQNPQNATPPPPKDFDTLRLSSFQVVDTPGSADGVVASAILGGAPHPRPVVVAMDVGALASLTGALLSVYEKIDGVRLVSDLREILSRISGSIDASSDASSQASPGVAGVDFDMVARRGAAFQAVCAKHKLSDAVTAALVHVVFGQDAPVLTAELTALPPGAASPEDEEPEPGDRDR